MRGRRYVPVAERLERNSIPEPNSGCLLWMGALSGNGHGRMKIDGRWDGVHRAAFALKHGPIPSGLFVCHRCDVRACINPDHLFLGTHGDNMADMARKGRSKQPRGIQAARAKLTERQVMEIRADARSSNEVSRVFGLARSTVQALRSGKTWKHLPSPAEPLPLALERRDHE